MFYMSSERIKFALPEKSKNSIFYERIKTFKKICLLNDLNNSCFTTVMKIIVTIPSYNDFLK